MFDGKIPYSMTPQNKLIWQTYIAVLRTVHHRGLDALGLADSQGLKLTKEEVPLSRGRWYNTQFNNFIAL